VAVIAAAYQLLNQGDVVLIDEAVYRGYHPDDASGSGVFDAFVRLGGTDVIKGYNTDGTLEWDTKSGAHTKAILLSAIPIIDDPDYPGIYREVQLDINQTAGADISLDEVEFWLTDDQYITGYDYGGGTGFSGQGADKVYELDDGDDHYVQLNYDLAAGSGKRDMILRVPDSYFQGQDFDYCGYLEPGCTTWFVLFSQFGDDATFPNDDGFEEWGVELYVLAVKFGYKFHDLNADGIWQDATEPGLEGWTIYVDINDNGQYDLGEPFDVTDADGYYEIDNITAGTYKVREKAPEGETGWVCSFPSDTDAFGCYYEEIFEFGVTYGPNNFGNYMTATKSGHKWHDLDADGVWDASEPGLTDWTIQLYDDVGNFLASTTTGAGGFYEFSGLDPGDYVVKEVCEADWFQSFPTPTDGCGSGVHAITLVSNETDSGNDFGNWRYATKSGTKFEDLNADGVRDAGEPGVPGVEICANGTCTTTDANGDYSLTLKPGSYLVCEQDVSAIGWVQSYPDNTVCSGVAGAAPGGWDITLVSNETDSGNDFGNWRYATKSGFKWHDFNEDGVWDAIEPALTGWTIELWDVNDLSAPVASTTTDANGYYEFASVEPGKDYAVCEVLSLGYFQTFPTGTTTPPADESIFDCTTALGATYGPFGYAFSPKSGDEFLENDFGNVEPQGCTLTQGYWKTHSIYGPAGPSDDGWYTEAGTYPPGAAGPDAPLFDSGLTWLEAFNTPPSGGNAWFILSHQWMAAYLNFYNGAGSGGTDVVQWITDGADLLMKYDAGGPETIGENLIPKDATDDRAEAIWLAGMLGDYNEGAIGPGHCDD
jgi:hypothetical protein